MRPSINNTVPSLQEAPDTGINTSISDILTAVCRMALEAGDMSSLLGAIKALVESSRVSSACRILVLPETSGDGAAPAYLVTADGFTPLGEAQSIENDPLWDVALNQDIKIVPALRSSRMHRDHTVRAMMAGWTGFTAVPFQDGKLRGAVALYRHGNDAKFHDDYSFLAAIAQGIGLGLRVAHDKSSVIANDHTLNMISKAIPGVVYQRRVSATGEICYTYISESAREFFGVDPKQILSDPQALFAHYDPDYRDSFREKLIEASKNLSTWDVEAMIRLPDGGVRFTHAMARPERKADGSVLWTGVILDANRIKQAELAAALAESRTRSNIIESLSQAFLMFDAGDHLLLANSHFYELFPEFRKTVVPGCTYEEFARLEHEAFANRALVLPEAFDDGAARRRHRENGRMIVERHLSDDRWMMVSEHRTDDGSTVILYTDVSELKQRERRIQHLAYHDSLTGLCNRNAFRRTLDEVAHRVSKSDRTLALMCLDIDRFKLVNDTLGHPIGDELLMQVAARLRSVIREGETAARLGGDEFAIILELDDAAYASDLALRIISAVSKPFDLAGHSVRVTTSVGIDMVRGARAVNVDAVMKNADLALYQAKSNGRDTFCFFKEEMDAAAEARRMLEMDLRNALQNEEMRVYYQPLVNTTSREIVGMEALLRWQHPVRGLVQPDDFIPVAEEGGLIPRIGEWVLKRACHDAVGWPGNLRVAVNLSPSQFRDQNFAEVVRENLRSSGLEPQRLELEVTESLLLRDTVGNLNILSEIKAMGVRIAMDDFGTGYSSLANLRSFPFDKIKIDRSFVRGLEQHDDAAAIIKAVLGLAKGLGISTTAEGVETSVQYDYLRAEGCGEVQGFLFSKARPGHEVAEILSDYKLNPYANRTETDAVSLESLLKSRIA